MPTQMAQQNRPKLACGLNFAAEPKTATRISAQDLKKRKRSAHESEMSRAQHASEEDGAAPAARPRMFVLRSDPARRQSYVASGDRSKARCSLGSPELPRSQPSPLRAEAVQAGR